MKFRVVVHKPGIRRGKLGGERHDTRRHLFNDSLSLAPPLVREHRAITVIDDEEVAQPSDIVSVTFAG